MKKLKSFVKLGFKTYKAYRKSRLWKSIRRRAFNRHGRACRACDGFAVVLHHRSYGLEVMKGQNLGLLVPLCNYCHELIEFGPAGKRNLREANRELDRLTSEKEELDMRFRDLLADPKQ